MRVVFEAAKLRGDPLPGDIALPDKICAGSGGSGTLAWCAVACLILGNRLLTVSHASDLPFWDEWDADIANLLIPFQQGTLRLGDLLQYHIDHRIFFTRLLVLGQFLAGGRVLSLAPIYLLDVLLAAATYVGLLAAFARLVPPRLKFPFLLFGTGLFFAPFDWEAQLWAFCSQEYVCLALSAAAFFLIAMKDPLRPSWWLGLACGSVAFLSFAAGTLTALVMVGLVCVRWFGASGGERRGSPVHILVVAAAAAPALLFSSHATSLQGPGSGSLTGFPHGLLSIATWPGPTFPPGLAWAPFVIWAILLAGQRLRGSGIEHFALAFGAWLILVAVAIAFGRAFNTTSSRYLALFVIGAVLNAALLVRLAVVARRRLAGRWAAVVRVLAVVWFAALGGGAVHAMHGNRSDMRRYTAQHAIEERNVAAYLRSGDPKVLIGQAYRAIPYPDGHRLITILGEAQAAGLRIDLPFAEAPDRAGRWQRWAATAGLTLLFVGIGLLGVVGRQYYRSLPCRTSVVAEVRVSPASASRPAS
jgi:hypothetical protein